MSEPLVRTRGLGGFRLHALDGGRQHLDGGAMFGVVPKPLWEKRIAADARNRIPLALRCLLVETGDTLVLIDNGVGNKQDAKFLDIYGIENESTQGRPTRLEDALAAAGFGADDVGIVIETHLHFDHAGGSTRINEAGRIVPAFPRARYIAQRGEYEYAHSQNERIRASYLFDNFEPLAEAGVLELVTGAHEVVPGIELLPTPGHTPHHQSVVIRSGGESACFLADVIPTAAHLPLAWIMGYDVEPLVTLETKRWLLERARREGWLLVFEHDPVTAWGRLDPAEARPMLGAANDAV
ncbi:MAG TPA: MBL fold metallo-hydrolase [Longimicrobiales bacterium]|nr:MBL fold metallo-hydrolase [Longimicrobiales bacterium]